MLSVKNKGSLGARPNGTSLSLPLRLMEHHRKGAERSKNWKTGRRGAWQKAWSRRPTRLALSISTEIHNRTMCREWRTLDLVLPLPVRFKGLFKRGRGDGWLQGTCLPGTAGQMPCELTEIVAARTNSTRVQARQGPSTEVGVKTWGPTHNQEVIYIQYPLETGKKHLSPMDCHWVCQPLSRAGPVPRSI